VGPPSFKEAHFVINKDTVFQQIKMNY
jgi:uncharacterized protein (DUF2141 family)